MAALVDSTVGWDFGTSTASTYRQLSQAVSGKAGRRSGYLESKTGSSPLSPYAEYVQQDSKLLLFGFYGTGRILTHRSCPGNH